MTYNQVLKEVGSGQDKDYGVIGFVYYLLGCLGDCVCVCVFALNVS